MTNTTEIRKYIQEVGEKIGELSASIARKKEEIAQLESAPLTKKEVVETLTDLVDREADANGEHLAGWITRQYINSPSNDHKGQSFPLLHVFSNNYTDRNKISPGMLMTLLREPIKQALASHVEALPFPENAVSLKERQQRIEILQGQVEKADAELKELQKELREIGVQTVPQAVPRKNYSGGFPLSELPPEARPPARTPGEVTNSDELRKKKTAS